MTRQVPLDQPLSDPDREYLLSRGLESTVQMIDSRYAEGDEVEEDPIGEGEDPQYEQWTGPELEKELKARSLPHSGSNAERAARLRQHDAQNQP